MLICNSIPTLRYRIRKCLQKIPERDQCASDINFHSINADVRAKKKSHVSVSEEESTGVLRQSWAPAPQRQLGSQVPQTAGQAKEQALGEGAGAEMLQCTTAARDWLYSSASRHSLKWKWGFPATLPSSYSKCCSKTRGKQAACSVDLGLFHRYSAHLRGSFNCYSKSPIQ